MQPHLTVADYFPRMWDKGTTHSCLTPNLVFHKCDLPRTSSILHHHSLWNFILYSLVYLIFTVLNIHHGFIENPSYSELFLDQSSFSPYLLKASTSNALLGDHELSCDLNAIHIMILLFLMSCDTLRWNVAISIIFLSQELSLGPYPCQASTLSLSSIPSSFFKKIYFGGLAKLLRVPSNLYPLDSAS